MPNSPASRSSGSSPTPSVTGGSPPRRHWTTASSITSSPAPKSTDQDQEQDSTNEPQHCPFPRRSRESATADARSNRASGALHPAVVHRAQQLRHQGVQPVQQTVRGAHHLSRRAGGRRIRERHHGPVA